VNPVSMRLDHGGDELVESHEINVTPFIDVMLVLLIIFMVAAPLATVDLPVDLPTSNAAPQPRPEKPLLVTVRSDLSLAVGDKKVALNELGPALDAAGGNDKGQRVFVRADRKVDYGHLMDVMNVLCDAGYLKVGLVGIEEGAGE